MSVRKSGNHAVIFFNLLFFFLTFIQLLSLPSYVYPVLNSVCIPVQIKLTFISMHKFESSGCVQSFLSSSYPVFIPLLSLCVAVPDPVPVWYHEQCLFIAVFSSSSIHPSFLSVLYSTLCLLVSQILF